MISQSPFETLDLSWCEQEPIHIPGAIQGHGYLLAAHLPTGLLQWVSANVSDLLGKPARELISQPYQAVLPQALVHSIEEWLPQSAMLKRHFVEVAFDTAASGNEEVYHCYAHLSEQLLIIEVEPIVGSPEVFLSRFIGYQQNLLTRFQQSPNLEDLLYIAAEEVRKISEFDRVMVYQFDESYNGRVSVEVRKESLHSFYNQHFPASDIPSQARALYLKNLLRLIPDIYYKPVSLLAAPSDDPSAAYQSIDLSLANLRSVSPVHLEYLHYMGVRATMTISLIVDGKLWGLITCHHYEPKPIDLSLRNVCELIARTLSYQIKLHTEAKRTERNKKSFEAVTKLFAQIRNGDVEAALAKEQFNLTHLADCEGAAFIAENRCVLLGKTPPEAEVIKILHTLLQSDEGPIFSTDHLASLTDEAHTYSHVASGVMMAVVSKVADVYLLWFRPEIIRTRSWAGNPNKAIEQKGEGEEVRLSPRKSFEKWEEIIRYRSYPWEPHEMYAASLLRDYLQDLYVQMAEQLEERNRELNKLVKTRTRELQEMLHREQEMNEEMVAVEEELRQSLNHSVRLSNQLQNTVGELDAVMHNSSIGIAYVDEKGRFTKVNPAFCNFFEKTEVELVGRSFTDVLCQDGAIASQQALQIFRKLVQEGSFSRNRAELKVGNATKFAELHQNVIRFEYQPPFVVMYINDRTQQREYEYSLEHANIELSKINSELDRFVYSVSHQLRSPLTSILGLINLARLKEDLDPEVSSYLAYIEKSIKRLDEAVHEINHYFQNARQEIHSVLIDFDTLLPAVLESLTYIDPERNVAVTVENDGQNVPFYGDPYRIKFILQNLLSNALKFHQKYEENPFVKVHITTTHKELLLEIQDNGIGIAPEHLPHIFNMFYRGSEAYAGAGLGLYIVKETISKLKGSVSVSSVHGSGSLFKVTLPNSSPAIA